MEVRQELEQQANARATGEDLSQNPSRPQTLRHPSNTELDMSTTATTIAPMSSPSAHLPPLQTQSQSQPQPQFQSLSPSQQQEQIPSPTSSPSRRRSPPLTISLPPTPTLTSPSPPSNTLLITRLNDPTLFHPASLATIRAHISSLATHPLNSFSPLKSLARIIVSFASIEDCIAVRTAIDGTAFTDGVIAKCYFGEPTPLADEERKYLEKPDAGKLFFISPPPSPPVGWESRLEDAPNSQVHAEDLASVLGKLTSRMHGGGSPSGSADGEGEMVTAEELGRLKMSGQRNANANEGRLSPVAETPDGSGIKRRSRSSTLIYDPRAHGDSPNLPAVMVEAEEDDEEVKLDDGSRGPPVHTSRPPVELM